jgi:hypothetical protein
MGLVCAMGICVIVHSTCHSGLRTQSQLGLRASTRECPTRANLGKIEVWQACATDAAWVRQACDLHAVCR